MVILLGMLYRSSKTVDNTMSPVTKQSPELTESEASNEGVDRISDLPESILIDILSLLPTHRAVQTSLLSTKWKFLWKNIYNLSFDDTNWRPNRIEHTSLTSFALLVNKVLTSLNEQSINKFSLRVFRYCKQYDITSWISAAISKNAKVIEYADHYTYQMPSSLYSCTTLENLRLDASFLNVPSLVSLPNLKTLRLENSSEESVSKLISGCSSLENLEITSYVHTLTISSPTIRNLSLKKFGQRSYFFEDDITTVDNSKIVINAPQLRNLNLDNVDTRNFSVENLCLLDEAHINLFFDEFHEPLTYDQYSKAVLKLFQGLYNVKTLSLMGHTFQVLNHASVIPRFSRLFQLTVEVRIQLKALFNLLEGCNELQSLTVLLNGHFYKEDTSWSEPEKVPICVMSSLHTISVHEIKEREFEMIAYMLENAEVLETMRIQAYDFEDNEKLLQKIQNVRPRSETCQVIFLNP